MPKKTKQQRTIAIAILPEIEAILFQERSETFGRRNSTSTKSSSGGKWFFKP